MIFGPVLVPTAQAQLTQIPVINALFPCVLELLALLQGFLVIFFLLVSRFLLAINPSQHTVIMADTPDIVDLFRNLKRF